MFSRKAHEHVCWWGEGREGDRERERKHAHEHVEELKKTQKTKNQKTTNLTDSIEEGYREEVELQAQNSARE